VQLLIGAAQYWCTLEAVSGEESELWTRCTALLELGQIGREGVVDLCIAAAQKFVDSDDEAPVPVRSDMNDFFVQRGNNEIESSGPALRSFNDSQDMLSVSANLPQHVRGSVEAQFSANCRALSAADKDAAVVACFQCLVQHILTVGSDVRRLGTGILPAESRTSSESSADPLAVAQHDMQQMIARANHLCSSSVFYNLLGDRLYRDNQSQLMAEKSPHIEEYLKLKDHQLLYRFAFFY
jgi:hypothetical protein